MASPVDLKHLRREGAYFGDDGGFLFIMQRVEAQIAVERAAHRDSRIGSGGAPVVCVCCVWRDARPTTHYTVEISLLS